MSHFRPTFVDVPWDRLKHNFDLFASSSMGQNFICPMVKANAYGHGDIQVAEHLQKWGCERVGVGLVEEGVRLRRAGLKLEILAFGFHGWEACHEILREKLIPVVSDQEQLDQLNELSSDPVYVHLKVNTGMNRLGFTVSEALQVVKKIQAQRKIRLIGCGTHLMTAEDMAQGAGHSSQQLKLFGEFLNKAHLPESIPIHVYNTSGASYALNAEGDYPHYGLRPGLGLYGYSSVPSPWAAQLKPVMSFCSQVTSVQSVKKGQRVSYGGEWVAPEDTVVGVVPAGYADGVPVALSSCGHVIVRGVMVPIVGRVCMDYTLVNVSAIPSPLGQKVEFFGDHLHASEVAKTANTSVYELLTRVSERVPRRFVEGIND